MRCEKPLEMSELSEWLGLNYKTFQTFCKPVWSIGWKEWFICKQLIKNIWLHCWNIIRENYSQVAIHQCHWHVRIYPKYFTNDDANSPSTSCHMTNFIIRFLAKNENKRLHRFKLAPMMTKMSQRAERGLEQKAMQEKQTLPFPVKVTQFTGLCICILVLTSYCTAISTD